MNPVRCKYRCYEFTPWTFFCLQGVISTATPVGSSWQQLWPLTNWKSPQAHPEHKKQADVFKASTRSTPTWYSSSWFVCKDLKYLKVAFCLNYQWYHLYWGINKARRGSGTLNIYCILNWHMGAFPCNNGSYCGRSWVSMQWFGSGCDQVYLSDKWTMHMVGSAHPIRNVLMPSSQFFDVTGPNTPILFAAH